MTYQRLAYDDASPAHEMSSDCRAVEAALRLPEKRTAAQRAAAAAVQTPPSILFEDYPRELVKRPIRVDAAAARLADALHLHLD